MGITRAHTSRHAHIVADSNLALVLQVDRDAGLKVGRVRGIAPEASASDRRRSNPRNTMGVLSLLLKHPGDLVPLLKVKRMADKAKKLPKEPNLAFCYDMLNKVSRSFAIVIQQLPHELQDAVCIFYLVLRALDTVEDDMSIPDEVKCPELEAFHERIYDKKYVYPCGEKHYKVLMDEYPKVTAVFLSLKKEYRDVIADITKRMGEGMSNFIKREVVTLKDWNEYCHYVAGLVGIGLSNLWASSMLEDKRFAEMEDLSNEMGLFLQKTNIIRDYRRISWRSPRRACSGQSACGASTLRRSTRSSTPKTARRLCTARTTSLQTRSSTPAPAWSTCRRSRTWTCSASAPFRR